MYVYNVQYNRQFLKYKHFKIHNPLIFLNHINKTINVLLVIHFTRPLLVTPGAFRFAIRIDSNHESIRIYSFCKKSAFRFTITGFCVMNNIFQCL